MERERHGTFMERKAQDNHGETQDNHAEKDTGQSCKERQDNHGKVEQSWKDRTIMEKKT